MKKIADGGLVQLKEVLVTVTCTDGHSYVDVFLDIKSAIAFVGRFLKKHASDVFDVRLVPVFK